MGKIRWFPYSHFLCLALLSGWYLEGSSKDVAAEAVIEIDAAKPLGYKIPRTIFGSFLEPIGHSIYGGLWAELLENPSFEENLWNATTIGKMIADEPGLG